MDIKEIISPSIKTESSTEESKHKNIIIFNDNVNTFEHIIVSLIDLCDHKSPQAEQCAYLIHYSGKCAVKRGSYAKLKPVCSALLDRGISAEIQ